MVLYDLRPEAFADLVEQGAEGVSSTRELFKLAVRKYPPTDDSLEVVRLYEELCNADV